MGPATKLLSYVATLVVAFAVAWSLGVTLSGTGAAHQVAAFGNAGAAPFLVPPSDGSGTQTSADGITKRPITTGQRTAARADAPATSAGVPGAAAKSANRQTATPGEPASTTAAQDTPSPSTASSGAPTTSSQPPAGCAPGGLFGPVICGVLGLFG